MFSKIFLLVFNGRLLSSVSNFDPRLYAICRCETAASLKHTQSHFPYQNEKKIKKEKNVFVGLVAPFP